MMHLRSSGVSMLRGLIVVACLVVFSLQHASRIIATGASLALRRVGDVTNRLWTHFPVPSHDQPISHRRVLALALALCGASLLAGGNSIASSAIEPVSSFGQGGLVTTNFVNTPDYAGAFKAFSTPWTACTSYTSHLIGGSSDRGSGADFVVALYDEMPTTTFRQSNLLIADAGGMESGTGLATYSSGSIGYIAMSGYSTQAASTDFAFASFYCFSGIWQPATATTDLGGTDRAYAVAIQSGKAVLAGTSDASGSNDFVLVRYLPTNADVDTTFGTGGSVFTDLSGGSDDQALALTTQSDGKLVAAGTSDDHLALVRYDANGSLDTTFNSTGIVTTDLGPGKIASAKAVVVLTDGSILLAGTSSGDFVLARYTSAGVLDNTFGAGGVVTTDFGSADAATSISVESDGRLLVTGTSGGQLAAARYNADGSPDGSFGDSGKTMFDAGSATYNTAGTAILSDGTILLVGTVSHDGLSDFGAVRLNSDGSTDTTFGDSGQLVLDLGSFDSANGFVIQPDGKMVAGGTSTKDNQSAFALARYNEDGTLDSSFGQSGLVRSVTGGAYQIALQADGKIVQVGSSMQDTIIKRFTTGGELDPAFGSGGTVIRDLCGGTDYINDVAVQPDQKIVVAGECVNPTLVVARFNPDGSLDTSFGSGGKIISEINASLSSSQKLALQPDGKIIVTAYSHGNVIVARLNPDGTFDTGFATNGVASALYPAGNMGLVRALALQPDGKIVVGGVTSTNNQHWDWALLRLNSDGTLDTSFDGDGLLHTDLGSDVEVITSLALQPDGRIIAGGDSTIGVHPIALVRYNTDGSIDTTFGNDGVYAFSRTNSTLSAMILTPEQELFISGTTNLGLTSDFMVVHLNLGQPDAPSDLAAVATGLTSIALSWVDNVSDETNFRIERSKNGATDWSEIATVGLNTHTYSDTSLTCGQIRFYRIRAYRDSDGLYSTYSNIASETTDACIPLVSLSVTSPYDFGNVMLTKSSAPQTVTLTNSGDLDLEVYDLALATGTDFSLGNNLCSNTTVEPHTSCTFEVTFSPLAPEGAKSDTLTIPSNADSSPDHLSLTGNGTPLVVVLKTPANGAAVYTTKPKLTWEAVPGATRYRVTVKKGAKVVIDKNATGASFTPPTALAYGRYTWHVAATQGVITPPSPDWVFYVTNMVNPANAATGLTGTPTFRWKSLGTGITYKLVIASDAAFTHPVRTVSRLKNLAYTLPASKTLPPGVYYWRIVTSSGKTMPGWTFTVGP